jgi:hypothetical protein
MISRLLPLVFTVAGVLMANHADAVQSGTYLQPIGGGGGTDFNGACKSGELLTGFQLRIIDGATGSVPGFGSLGSMAGYLDAVRPICSTASAPDHVAAPSLVGTWGGVKAGDENAWRNAGFFGGALTVSNNAQMRNRLCPADQPIVTGIKANYGKNRGFVVVLDIQTICGLASAQQTTTSVKARTGAQSRSQSAEEAAIFGTQRSQSCPRGQVAIGAHGRAGALVDALGLICGAPSVVPAHAPTVIAVRNSVTSASMIARSAGVATAPVRQPAAPPIDEAHPAIIYGIGADGVLRWYRHNGATTGAGIGVPGSWAGAKNVSGGWASYKQVFAGGNGVIYGITQDGKLTWSRHTGLLTGQGSDEPGAWEEAREVSGDFGQYRKVFSAGDGVIYAIAEDGQLFWMRHVGFADGTPSFEGPIAVAAGWGEYELVFSGGHGVIYAAGADGILKWNKHLGFESGAAEWQGPKDVGRGWNGLRTAFSAGGGIIYSIAPDGILRWYRHNGYLDGAGLESAGSWEARTDVGRGWNSFATVIAQF